VPRTDKVEISGVFRPIFLWWRGAHSKGFSEGEKFPKLLLAGLFWFLAAMGGFDVK
jgi:hypothetical protein